MDDADLTFENYEELFGTSHVQTEQLFDDAGIDSYFEMKDVPADESNEVRTFLHIVFLSAVFVVGKELCFAISDLPAIIRVNLVFLHLFLYRVDPTILLRIIK